MTATVDELHQLADRCEREEPSWELTRAIGIAVMGWIAQGNLIRTADGDLFVDSPGSIHPAPLESIDVAASLMVDGAMMRNTRQHQDIFMFRYVHPLVGGNAKTEPMARTAAALRAHAFLLSDAAKN